jgi:hypothetical protein
MLKEKNVKQYKQGDNKNVKKNEAKIAMSACQ